MPISDDLHHRSLVTKLLGYKHIVCIPNSVSVLADLLPCSIDMALKRRTGIYNFTNPGAVTHPQLLQLYKDIVDSSVTWQIFDLEQQALVIKAPRSNTELDCSKLLAEYPLIPDAVQAITGPAARPHRSKYFRVFDSWPP
jgi:3,5-epimerase/4-reductase